MVDGIINLIIVLAVLLVAWYVAARFSPDALLTKIVQIVIFVIALIVILKWALPLVGI